MCVLHIKPLFLPVDIQHNQCPCRFVNPRRDTSPAVVTKVRHRDTTTLPRTRHQVLWAMQCHVIVLDTTDTTHTLYKIEKRKETKKKQKQRRQIKREKEEKKTRRNKLSCRPRRRCGKHLKISSWEKWKTRKTPLRVNRVRQRTKGIYRGGNSRQSKAQSTLQVAAAVCGTSSVARFSLLVRLVPCYPDCRLRPAFVNYAQPLGVRQYETSRAGLSSTHATRLLQYGLSQSKRGWEIHIMKITGNQRKKGKIKQKEEETKKDHVRTSCTIVGGTIYLK